MTEMSSAVNPSQIVNCWSDDDRMNFLFSAFPPSRSVNSHHWDTKMSFWKNLIVEMSTLNAYGYISWDNLFSHLTRNGKQPLGLQVVFQELIESGELIPTMQYSQDISADETWVGWGLKWCVKKPVGWMTDKVLSPIKPSPYKDLKRGQYVLIPVLERKCQKLQSRFSDYVSENKSSSDYEFLNIISYSKLQDIVKDMLSDSESLDLALATLRKNKLIEIWSPNERASNTETHRSSEKFIKFAKIGDKSTTPFSETDIGIIKLCEARSQLHGLIDKSYQEMKQYTQNARTSLKNNQKSMAKNALRKKRRIEATLNKKEQSLNNVEQLLESLHQCQTDKMLVETYKAAVSAHRDTMSGLSPEEVQSTMDDMANVLDTQADISEALSEDLSLREAIKVQDLEEELASLLEPHSELDVVSDLTGQMKNIKIGDECSHFPSIPNHSPKVAKSNGQENGNVVKEMALLSS